MTPQEKLDKRSLCRGYGDSQFMLNLFEVSKYYYQIELTITGETPRVIRGIIGTFRQANEVYKEYLKEQTTITNAIEALQG
jgi:hypothetical protein